MSWKRTSTTWPSKDHSKERRRRRRRRNILRRKRLRSQGTLEVQWGMMLGETSPFPFLWVIELLGQVRPRYFLSLSPFSSYLRCWKREREGERHTQKILSQGGKGHFGKKDEGRKEKVIFILTLQLESQKRDWNEMKLLKRSGHQKKRFLLKKRRMKGWKEKWKDGEKKGVKKKLIKKEIKWSKIIMSRYKVAKLCIKQASRKLDNSRLIFSPLSSFSPSLTLTLLLPCS